MKMNQSSGPELDKRAAKVLRLLRRQQPMSTQTADEVRNQLARAGNPFAAPEVHLAYRQDHTVTAADGAALLLREYSPVEKGSVSPAILFFHGGGFVIGSVAEYDSICSQLAARSGARVFSLEYRLAPQVKYPVPHEDSRAAYRWLLGARDQLALTGIGVCGDSAGGNLAASLCLYARNSALEEPALQMLWYPMTHGSVETESRRRFAQDYYITEADMRWFSAQLFEESKQNEDIYFAPGLGADLSGLAPAYVMTAGFDVLHDEGELYAKKLEASGVATEYHCRADMFHGFISFAGALAQGMDEIYRTADFFRARTGK